MCLRRVKNVHRNHKKPLSHPRDSQTVRTKPENCSWRHSRHSTGIMDALLRRYGGVTKVLGWYLNCRKYRVSWAYRASMPYILTSDASQDMRIRCYSFEYMELSTGWCGGILVIWGGTKHLMMLGLLSRGGPEHWMMWGTIGHEVELSTVYGGLLSRGGTEHWMMWGIIGDVVELSTGWCGGL